MNIARQQDKNKLKNIFLVHGEDISMQALAKHLEAEGYKVTMPEKEVNYIL